MVTAKVMRTKTKTARRGAKGRARGASRDTGLRVRAARAGFSSLLLASLLGLTVTALGCSSSDDGDGKGDGGAVPSPDAGDALAPGVDASGSPDGDPDAPSPADVVTPPLPGPDGSALSGDWVAFASNRRGNFDLYLIRPDGSDLHALVQGPGDQLFPSWSPDGKTVAYASDASGAYQLYLVDASTGAAHPLPNDRPRASAPSFSPDGTTLVFGGDGTGGGLIYTVPVAGGHATALTTGASRDGSPVWSPDGTVVYFASNRAGPFEIWSVKADGTGLSQVTSGSALLGGPAITPDGASLAFTRSRPASADSGTGPEVMLFTIATKTMSVLSAMNDSEVAFAPKGGVIGLTTTRFSASNAELVLLGPDAAAPFRLTNDPAVDSEIAFRPSP